MAKMLDAALEYAGRGWPIFPIQPNAKEPFPYTNGVLDATTDPKQIKLWWQRWPNANIGLDVGGAGMVALDLDPGHDRKALDALFPTKTGLRARTPRGGEHLFFTLAQGEIVAPSASKISPHVDVRSFHSYVLLAPSVTGHGTYDWLEFGKPATRANELLRLANVAKEKDPDRDTWLIEPDLPENIALATDWLKSKAKIAIEGQGGDATAYATAAMCKSYGLSPDTAFDLMIEHWNPRCSPPWSEDELDHLQQKIENSYAYNTSKPGNMTPAFKAAMTKALFTPIQSIIPSGNEFVTPAGFRFADREGMKHIKAPEWIIPEFLAEDSYMLLFGPYSTYKTFVALDVALAIATNCSEVWPKINRHGPVLFTAGEGRAGITKRVQAWEKHNFASLEAHNFVLADPVPLVSQDAKWDEFVRGALKLNPNGYRLVVLDTVARAMQGVNENAQEHASKFTALTQLIRKELGASVLAIHHTGHDNTERAAGSKEFGGSADTLIGIEPTDIPYRVSLVMPKQKDAPEWDKAKQIQLTEVHLSPTTKSLVATLHKPDPKQAEAVKDIERKAASVHKKIDSILSEVLKSNRVAWSAKKLAIAIAAHKDAARMSYKTIMNKYLIELRETPDTHARRCFDALKNSTQGQWQWVEPTLPD